MKVAITSEGTNLDAQVDPRFGRCAYFLLVDTETMEFEAVQNPNTDTPGGAGIQSAQLVANKGAQVLLTGSCGPNAFQTLQAAGVQVIVGISGTIRDAVERYKSGEFQPTAQPNVGARFGTGGGMGMGYGPMPQAPSMPQLTKEQEIQMLKQQQDFIKQQVNEINKRIKELEEKKGGD